MNMEVILVAIVGSIFFLVGITIISLHYRRQKRDFDEHVFIETNRLEKQRKDNAEETIAYFTQVAEEKTNELSRYLEEERETSLRNIASETQREYDRQVALMQSELSSYASYIDGEFVTLTNEFLAKSKEARLINEQLTQEVEDVASRLVSLTEAERTLVMEREAQSFYSLRLSEDDVRDIKLFFQEILPRVSRKEAISKLIWSIYIERPTNLLLNRIAPKDFSGIYKITHIPDKKCYVGRSVSVRQRLTQHIRSSLGIGTIADQAIHYAMHDLGLHNFIFEIVEECSKDKLNEREKYYIDVFQSHTYGWNGTKGG